MLVRSMRPRASARGITYSTDSRFNDEGLAFRALKALDVIAWANGPGSRVDISFRALKARHHVLRDSNQFSMLAFTFRAFSAWLLSASLNRPVGPGYHISRLRPFQRVCKQQKEVSQICHCR